MTEHTLSLTEGIKPPVASIADMAWLEGHWSGEAQGSVSEEIWSGTSGSAMMGMYRLVRGGKTVFYELMTIVEENDTLLMRLKHFNPDLTGSEEKQRTVDFRFVSKDGGSVFFEGMTYRPEGNNAVTVFPSDKRERRNH